MAVLDLGALPMPRPPAEDVADIQGLLRTGYGTLDAVFLLLRVADAASARAWLATARVTTVADLAGGEVESALQVAVTARGLRALDVPEAIIGGFSNEFLGGVVADDAGADGPGPRSRRLGDVGPNAPAGWDWGRPGEEPDLLVMLYAKRGGLPAMRHSVESPPWQRGFAVLAALDTADLGRREPFGFADGISQPQLDWIGERRPGTDADLAYTNLIAAGEFLLGYPNEYGLYTERPLLDHALDPDNRLPAAEEDPTRRDLGRNGTYLVLRQLHQDVEGFWHFLRAQAGDGSSQLRLAEAMVGRAMDGSPLLHAEEAEIPGVGPDEEDRAANGFTYGADPDGLRCPLGAHVRRANPRTGDMPGGRQGAIAQLWRALGLGPAVLREDVIASSRFHRILRRGRAYAMQAGPGEAAPSGLHFICLNANIARQFEFIQGAWFTNTTFDGLSDEADPLVGHRQPHWRGRATDAFTWPRPSGGPTRRIAALPRFVTVRGGAYFFLPGVRALRHLAALGRDA